MCSRRENSSAKESLIKSELPQAMDGLHADQARKCSIRHPQAGVARLADRGDRSGRRPDRQIAGVAYRRRLTAGHVGERVGVSIAVRIGLLFKRRGQREQQNHSHHSLRPCRDHAGAWLVHFWPAAGGYRCRFCGHRLPHSSPPIGEVPCSPPRRRHRDVARGWLSNQRSD